MRVRFAITVDIDPEAWEANYGAHPHGLRTDVTNYLENLVVEQLASVDVLRSASIPTV